MKSGMLAAEAVYDQLTRESGTRQAVDLSSYDTALRESWVWEELQGCRNIRPGYALQAGAKIKHGEATGVCSSGWCKDKSW